MSSRLVEEVFVTEGVPEFTFVRPPNYGEIFVDIRRTGKPVIIEGQSGTGKTTCVKKILESIGGEAEYLTARNATHVSRIEALAHNPRAGFYVIDDFHRLASELQERLANIAKASSEEGKESALPKLVLIGINQVGSELIHLVPDIAKRIGIHRIQPGRIEQIRNLISEGCKELNITIENSDDIFNESKGDYWLTQQFCQTICILNNVFENQAEHNPLSFDVDMLRTKTVDRLKSTYYTAVKDFCRGRRFRPTNDPYFRLLKTISDQESSIVDVNELANANEDVRGSINNIKEHRLVVLLEEKPSCSRYFYYNSETKNFAIEDPALFYFIRHLDWEALRKDCGFRDHERSYEYDVALSFAGENRELAQFIAEQLSILDVNVFYDKHFEANFLGRTWEVQFRRIFGEDSRLVVCLLDKNHLEKIWPTFERECFQPRIEDSAIIPIRLDDTSFSGMPKDLIGIHFSWNPHDDSWKASAIDNIIFKLIDHLESL